MVVLIEYNTIDFKLISYIKDFAPYVRNVCIIDESKKITGVDFIHARDLEAAD